VRLLSRSILAGFLLSAASAFAGPVEFGLAELNAAMAARNLKWKNKAEISLDPAESFRIEPYSYGGAYINGGDLRGLMYGLLEAAEQIRANGRFAKFHSVPMTPLRGIRIAITPDLEQASPEFWRAYFQMLARNRFNRAHVIPPSLTSPYHVEKLLSQLAADYGVDFTLGIETEITGEELSRLLAACPMIRSVAIGSRSASREAVFSAVRAAGRRIALDFDGVTTVFDAASEKGVPLVRPISQWPPSFEIAAPVTPDEPDAHAGLYWVWGRLGYDAKAKLPKEADAKAFGAAREITLMLGAAGQAATDGSDFVATIVEAVDNRVSQFASAKLAPPEIVDRLEAGAAELEASANTDFKDLAASARARASVLRESYETALAATTRAPTASASNHAGEAADVHKPVPRPQWTHKPPLPPSGTVPLTVTLKLAAPKDIRTVRLHYRTLDPSSEPKMIELPAASEANFEIPAADLAGNWDVFYYFEILHMNGSGWFEPDPFTAATPYFTVHINAPRVGPN